MRRCLAVLLLVAACGDDGVHHLADAPPPPDVSTPDAPTSGDVSLTVTNLGTPVMGVPVYFQNADSSLVASMMTDATGTATATMEPGGYVTAVNPLPLSTVFMSPGDLRTFAGVKPGDHLRIDQTGGQVTTFFTVTVPVDANATEYKLYTSCSDGNVFDIFGSGSGFTPTFNVFVNGCAQADFAVVTFDINAAPSKAFFHAGQAIVADTQIDLNDTYVAPTTLTLNYTGVPAEFSSLRVDHQLRSAAGAMVQSNTGADVTAGAATVTIAQPPVAGPFAVISTALQPNGLGIQRVLDWGPQTNPHTLDLAGVTLPEYTALATLDIPAHTVMWTSSAGATQPDFVLVNGEIDRSSQKAFWRWRIVAPYTGTAVTLPVLPAPDADYNAVAGDQFFINGLVTAKVPGGYDAVRSAVLSFTGPEGLVTAAPGRAVFEDISLAVRQVSPWRTLHETFFGRR